jgi:hypothetical protein
MNALQKEYQTETGCNAEQIYVSPDSKIEFVYWTDGYVEWLESRVNKTDAG